RKLEAAQDLDEPEALQLRLTGQRSQPRPGLVRAGKERIRGVRASLASAAQAGEHRRDLVVGDAQSSERILVGMKARQEAEIAAPEDEALDEDRGMTEHPLLDQAGAIRLDHGSAPWRRHPPGSRDGRGRLRRRRGPTAPTSPRAAAAPR